MASRRDRHPNFFTEEQAMKTTKKLIFTLLAGATLGLASPVFADSYRHDRGYDHGRHFDRHAYSGHYVYRGYAHRPVIVERPYYAQPAANLGLGAIIGAAIGTIIDNQR